jgi:hypothetical protein
MTGLERFHEHISAGAQREIESWRGHAELGALVDSLEAISDLDQFLNTWAEALIARHLLQHGCDVRFEVRTPAGRSCDFEVRLDGQQFYLHVKRLWSDRSTHRHLTVSSRLRYLERILRPYVVRVRWHENASEDDMRFLVAQAAEFIHRAKVGDELVVRDAGGRELGGCRIVAPWEGDHVTLAIGLPSGFTDGAPRVHKLLRKAYQQFMPKAANVILIGSSHPHDVEDIETALLGSHIERWDAEPARGRVAWGRAADGFWNANHFTASSGAGWFLVDEGENGLETRLWLRPDASFDRPLRTALAKLFEAG